MGNVRQVGTFTLQSGGKANHANSAQFAPFPEGGNQFPYLYVSGNYTSYCGVYKVTTSGATLVQTISVVNERFDLQGMHPNVQAGDDGYLYAVPFATMLCTLAVMCIEGKSVIENSRRKKAHAGEIPDILRQIVEATTQEQGKDVLKRIAELLALGEKSRDYEKNR